MGTIRFGGVLFQVYSHDHLPKHVHGRYAGITVVVEIGEGMALVSGRKNAINPVNAKRSDVAYVLRMAQRWVSELNLLREETHGA